MHLLALVLSDCERHEVRRDHGRWHVLMHLLALGAFRLTRWPFRTVRSPGLNAPYGSWCFLA